MELPRTAHARAPAGAGPPAIGPSGPRLPELAADDALDRFRGASAVVVLPTLNERLGLARTLRDLPTAEFYRPGRRIQPLIIDGGSTDGTLEVAREWNVPVLHQTSRGKGGAMIEAISWVHRQNVPYVVVLDADATYPADRIVPALELLARGTDLVVGVRHPVWGPPSDLKDLVHRVGNLVLSYSASVLSRRPILDLCSGFWGISTARFLELELSDATFAIEAELILKAIRRGYSFHQIPIEYHERLGEAKLRAFRDGRRILGSIVREARPAPRDPASNGGTSTGALDVLSIGLTLGSPGLTLIVPPSEAVEAGRILDFLRVNSPMLAVSGRPGRPFSARRPETFGRTAPSDPGLPPLSLALAPPASQGAGAGRARVSIRAADRQLTVELPANAPGVPAVSPGGAWSRWAGWIPARLSLRTRASSLLVVTSRLDFHPDRQQETLFAANGFHVMDPGPDSDGSNRLPRGSTGPQPR